MQHNKNSRVKIPALVNFTRLGYEYVSLRAYSGGIDEDTNIFVEPFRTAINRINRTNLSVDEIRKIIGEIKIVLPSADLDRAFYAMLTLKLYFLKKILQATIQMLLLHSAK